MSGLTQYSIFIIVQNKLNSGESEMRGLRENV